MKRSALPHPLLSLALTILWVLLVNEISIGSVFFGLLLGWAIPFATRRYWPERVQVRKPMVLLQYIGLLLLDIFKGSFLVAYRILRGPQHLQPAFIQVPLRLRSELGISLLANTISLTPGTVSAQLSPDRRQLWIHALHGENPEAIVLEIQQRYEDPLLKIFEGGARAA
jgi:multicomponent K+:H+ antiporter subunit E